MAAAVALRAAVPRLSVLSEAERQLAAEWLDRVVEDPPQASRPSKAASSSAMANGPPSSSMKHATTRSTFFGSGSAMHLSSTAG